MRARMKRKKMRIAKTKMDFVVGLRKVWLKIWVQKGKMSI
jgi:hypothetical protein